MSKHLDRAVVLIQQSRHDLAEQELRLALGAEPENARAHALLALCLAKREQFQDATEEARQAIGLAPDQPFCHYVMASILHDRRRFDEAEEAITEAIRLYPEDADYWSVLAGIRLAQRRWPAALEAAQTGLTHDPEHVGCNNLRAMALVKLGRKAEAGATIDAALARDPEDAFSHANKGWTLLEQRDTTKALEHFREALRLDPELEYARAGIVEALKARHLIYALMLRYFLWMAKLNRKAQWAIIIGGYITYRILGNLAGQNPLLAPWLWPVLGLYIAFAIMTWVAYPLFNLLLRLNRFGRLALSQEQIVAANWVGSFLLGALICAGAYFVTGNAYVAWVGVVFGFLTLPLSAVFKCDPGWPRRAMAGITLLLGLIGCMVAVFDVLGMDDAMVLMINTFGIGVLLSLIGGNVLGSVTRRR